MKDTKKKIAELDKSIGAITADIDRMEKKRASVAGVISNLEASLKSSQDAHQEAVKSFARDEISEDELNKASKTSTDIEATLSIQQAVIEVVMNDILPREEDRAVLYKQRGRLREAAWRQIADAEVAKLSGPLKRAFAACRKTGLYDNHKQFCYHIAEKHLFEPDVVFDQAAEDLEREYL